MTTTSSAAPPRHGRHIPMLELCYSRQEKGNIENELSVSLCGLLIATYLAGEPISNVCGDS